MNAEQNSSQSPKLEASPDFVFAVSFTAPDGTALRAVSTNGPFGPFEVRKEGSASALYIIGKVQESASVKEQLLAGYNRTLRCKRAERLRVQRARLMGSGLTPLEMDILISYAFKGGDFYNPWSSPIRPGSIYYGRNQEYPPAQTAAFERFLSWGLLVAPEDGVFAYKITDLGRRLAERMCVAAGLIVVEGVGL